MCQYLPKEVFKTRIIVVINKLTTEIDYLIYFKKKAGGPFTVKKNLEKAIEVYKLLQIRPTESLKKKYYGYLIKARKKLIQGGP